MNTVKNPAARITMPGQIHKAYKVMLKLINPKYVKSDAAIPLKILQNAKGVAFITVVKAGFVWSGTLGSGIVVARLPDGSWSGPSSIGVGGMGWGALIGASVTDSVIILNNDLAVSAFAGHGQVKLGGNLSISAGPVGREGDASGYIAACYSYSHSRGLFAGLSLQGAIMVTRDSDNTRFYGHPCKASDILRGLVEPPPFEDLKRLHDCLNVVRNSTSVAYSFRDSNMQSFNDSAGVSFHANPQQQSGQGRPGAPSWANQDDDYEDDDKATQAANARFGWRSDQGDDDPYANAFSSSGSANLAQVQQALPPGWVQVDSPDGNPYFWNEALNITTWERPTPPQRKASAPPPPPPPPPPAAPSALPPGWVSVAGPSGGDPYYWNEGLNITQWDRPTAPPVPVRAPSIRLPAPAIPQQRPMLKQPVVPTPANSNNISLPPRSFSQQPPILPPRSFAQQAPPAKVENPFED